MPSNHRGIGGLHVVTAGSSGYDGTGKAEETKQYVPPEHMVLPHTKAKQQPVAAPVQKTEEDPMLTEALNKDLSKRNIRTKKKLIEKDD